MNSGLIYKNAYVRLVSRSGALWPQESRSLPHRRGMLCDKPKSLWEGGVGG